MSTDDWHSDLPPSRLEAHCDDRVVRCFVERPGSLHAMLESAVRRNPDGKALVCDDECLSWKEVSDRVACIAAGLAERGITQGSRVGLLLGNCIEFPLVLLAAARLGAIGVPFSYRSQRAELEFMLNQCGVSLLVFDADYSADVPSPQTVPMLKHRVVIGEAAHAEPYSNLLQGPPAAPAVSVAEDETALLLYTSGTTGSPKGAMLTHLCLVHSAMIYTHCMRLGMGDCTVLAVPLSHVTGIAGNLCVALHCASTLVIMRSFKAADFLRLAAEVRMTHTIIVPAMYKLFLMQPDFESTTSLPGASELMEVPRCHQQPLPSLLKKCPGWG
jgi:long-chain acyl-CoA synthetase